MARTTIPPELVAVNAIQGTLIADNSVTAVHIATNAISGTLVADNAITSTHIAQNNVTATQIAQNTITVTQMADSAIETAKINADAVTGAKIADNAIDSEHYTDGSIDTAHIADAQVTAAKIGANAVTLAKMASLTRGSILVGNSAADVAALAIGSANKILTSDGTDVIWSALNSGIDDNSNAVAMTIDSSEKVGIGDTSPFAKLHVEDTGWSSGAPYGAVAYIQGGAVNDLNWGHLLISQSGTTTDTGGRLAFGANGENPIAGIRAKYKGATYGDLAFLTRPSGGTNTERMVIDSSGNVGIGNNNPSGAYAYADNLVVGSTTGAHGMTILSQNNTNGALHFADALPGDDATTTYEGWVAYNHASNYMFFGTNHAERMRIHANGKAAWSANGIGSTGTVARDFAFYTEGSTNGVEVRSNDQRLLFFGAGGSGGTGVDDGYLAMSSQGTGKIAFNANGASYINGGRLGIGESDPNEPLTVRSSDENINCTLLEIGNDLHATNTKDAWMKFVCGAAQNDNSWAIGAYPGSFRFSYLGTRGTAVTTASAEKMRIDSSGVMGIGITTPSDNSTTCLYLKGNEHVMSIRNLSTSSAGERVSIDFLDHNGTRRGYVSVDTSGTLFSTSSDYRLKNVIEPVTNGIERINKLNPVKFEWKETGKEEEGFIAHEVDEIFKDAVGGEKDAVNEDGSIDGQTMDYGRITPLLVKAIQEQQTIIEDLKTRIETLEG